MTILVPDDEQDCFGKLRKKIDSDKNGLAFYSGPVLPPRADGSLIKLLMVCLSTEEPETGSDPKCYRANGFFNHEDPKVCSK